MAFVGKFELNREFLCNEPDLCQQILSHGVVLRAEAIWHSGSIEYIMYSPSLFREINEGEVVPRYIFNIAEFREEGTGEFLGYEFHAEEI